MKSKGRLRGKVMFKKYEKTYEETLNFGKTYNFIFQCKFSKKRPTIQKIRDNI